MTLDAGEAHTGDHTQLNDLDELGELFSRAARQLRRGTLSALEPSGINPHQARVLRLIVKLGPVRPTQLADQLSIALRSVTQVVDALVAAGLVNRDPDPDDRRAVLLSATANGQVLADQIAKIRGEQSRRFLAGLDAHDRAELSRILHLLEAGPAWQS